MEKSGKIYKILPYVILSLAVCLLFAYLAFAEIESVSLTAPANNTWRSNGSWNADGVVSPGTTVNITFNCSAVTNLTEATGNISLLLGTSASTFIVNQTNTTVTANNTGYTFNVNTMPDGTYIWGCSAYNISGDGRGVSSNYTLYVDTAKPSLINLSRPSNGFNSSSATIDFNWTAIDNIATTFLCNLTLDNVIGNKTIMVSNNSLNNTQIANIPNGIHYWNVTCWDPTNASSNTNTSATFRFTVDTVAPAVTATRPENKTYNTNASIPINFSVSDATTLVSGCYYSLDNEASVALASCANTLVNVSANAAHNIRIFANDTVNNTNSSTVISFVSDLAKPSLINLSRPLNWSNSSSATIDFNWTAIDNIATTFLCNLTLDNVIGNKTIMVSNNSLNNTQIANIPNGIHYWNVTCWDPTNASSNTNTSATFRFTVDTVAPAVEATRPENKSYNTNASIPINFSVSDATTLASGCYYSLDNGASVALASCANALVNVSANAAHNIRIFANDTVNNTNSSIVIAFISDMVHPNATAAVSPAIISQSQSVTVTCGGVDALSAISNSFISVRLPSGSTVVPTSSTTFSDTSEAGTYTATCRTTDAAGWTDDETVTFLVEYAAGAGGPSSGSGTTTTGESHFVALKAAAPVEIKVSNAQNAGITGLVVESLADVANVKFTMNKLSSMPASITASPPGEAYSYVQISAPLAVGKVKQAKIKFDVLKSWMETKGVKADDIVMQHYDTEWKELPTVVVTEDSQKASYEATTTSFSTFVITAKAQAEEAPKEEVPVEEQPAEEKEPTEAAPPAAEIPAEGKAILPYVAAVAVILCIGVALAFVILRKKRKK